MKIVWKSIKRKMNEKTKQWFPLILRTSKKVFTVWRLFRTTFQKLDVYRSVLRKLFPTDLLLLFILKIVLKHYKENWFLPALKGCRTGTIFPFSLITSFDAPSVQATSLKWRSKLISRSEKYLYKTRKLLPYLFSFTCYGSKIQRDFLEHAQFF